MATASANPGPDYYLIGTKYEELPGVWNDMFPAMVRAGCVAVGYARGVNLSSVCGKGTATVDAFLAARGEPRASREALRHFLQLRPGDLVALKGSGSPLGGKPHLSVVGYAVIVGPFGPGFYSHDPALLGHCIRAEFLEVNVLRELGIGGLGRTVHRIGRADHLRAIFGPHAPGGALGPTSPKGGGTTSKNINGVEVLAVRSYRTRAYHNRIQQKLYNALRQRHGVGKVTMEASFIDVRVEEDDRVTLYEVKPHSTARQCVREALGQLLEYRWFVSHPAGKEVHLVAVGPTEATESEQEYLEHLSEVLSVPFSYRQCKA